MKGQLARDDVEMAKIIFKRVKHLEHALHDANRRECEYCSFWDKKHDMHICSDCDTVACNRTGCRQRLSIETCDICYEHTCVHCSETNPIVRCAGKCSKWRRFHSNNANCFNKASCGHGFCSSCQQTDPDAHCRFCLGAAAVSLLALFRQPRFKAFISKDIAQCIAKMVWNKRMK